jgi:hypothetical protein
MSSARAVRQSRLRVYLFRTLDFGIFSTSLYLPHDTECIKRFTVSSGRFSASLISLKGMPSSAFSELNSSNMIDCSVVTIRSNERFLYTAFTVAPPRPCTH